MAKSLFPVHLNEAVHRSGDEILAVRTEGGRFDVGLGTKLDLKT
jgi:hypothetical protein